MTTIYDSPNSDDFVSPIRLSVTPRLEYPFRQDLTAILYQVEYVQRTEFFVPAVLDLTCPDNSSAFLVEESNPQQKKDGLCRFTRTFATVPAGRTEYATGSFAFPSYKTDSDSTTILRPTFTQTVVAKVDFGYLKTTDPGADLTITNRFQPLDSSANKVNFVASDTTPTLTEYQNYVSGTPGGAILKEDGDKILLEDGVDALLEESGGVGTSTYVQSKETRVRRWKGNIWETSTRYVYAL